MNQVSDCGNYHLLRINSSWVVMVICPLEMVFYGPWKRRAEAEEASRALRLQNAAGGESGAFKEILELGERAVLQLPGWIVRMDALAPGLTPLTGDLTKLVLAAYADLVRAKRYRGDFVGLGGIDADLVRHQIADLTVVLEKVLGVQD